MSQSKKTPETETQKPDARLKAAAHRSRTRQKARGRSYPSTE